MRVARYAARKQKPAERTRCIYSSGSPHCSPGPTDSAQTRSFSVPFGIDSTHFFLLPPTTAPFSFSLSPTVRATLSYARSPSRSLLCHRDPSVPFLRLFYPFVASRSQLFLFFFSFPLFARNIPSTYVSLFCDFFFFLLRFFGDSFLFSSKDVSLCEGKVRRAYQKSIIENE